MYLLVQLLEIIKQVQLEAHRQTAAVLGALLLFALHLHRLQSLAAMPAPFIRLHITENVHIIHYKFKIKFCFGSKLLNIFRQIRTF